MKYVLVALILATFAGVGYSEPVRRGPPLITVQKAPGSVAPGPRKISLSCSIYTDAVYLTKKIVETEYTTETKLTIKGDIADKVADAFKQTVTPVAHPRPLAGSGMTEYLVHEAGKADAHKSNILYKFDSKEEAKNPSKFAEELRIVADELCGIKSE